MNDRVAHPDTPGRVKKRCGLDEQGKDRLGNKNDPDIPKHMIISKQNRQSRFTRAQCKSLTSKEGQVTVEEVDIRNCRRNKFNGTAVDHPT